jgi:hypothetical protein
MPGLRTYLKTYGREYSKKYSNYHFSSAPGHTIKMELVDELFSDEEEKAQYMVDAPAGIRRKKINYA